MRALGEPGEADATLEVREVVAHRNRGGREDHALHLGQPAGRKVSAHVDFLGHQALRRDSLAGAREVGRVDVALVAALVDETDAREELAQLSRMLGELGSLLGDLFLQRCRRLRDRANGLVQRVGADGRGVADLGPRPARTDVLVDPQRHGVIAPVSPGERDEAVDRLKEVRDGERGARRRGGGLGEQPDHERRALEGHRLDHGRMKRSGVCAAQSLERDARVGTRHLDRPLAARLRLEAMGLVHDPVAHRREDSPFRLDVAQQEGVVGHHHVRAARAAAGAVQKAGPREVRAAAVEALSWRDRKQVPRDVAPSDAERVEVALEGLARKRVGDRNGREHVTGDGVVRAAVMGNLAQRQLLADGTVEPPQAGIVIVALEARERESPGERRGECGKLMGDELVGERVGLCRHANAHMVAAGVDRLGEQVRY